MTVPTPHANLLPPRPRLVLRLGFAGARDLPTNVTEPLTTVLVSVFETIARQLVEIATGQPGRPGKPPRISRFYSQEAPLLRLITGLAEGADAFALGALDLVAAGPAPVSGFAAELAAVLPFDVAAYRRSRNEAFRPEFDRQAARCAYILTLDGIYDKPHPDTKLARTPPRSRVPGPVDVSVATIGSLRGRCQPRRSRQAGWHDGNGTRRAGV